MQFYVTAAFTARIIVRSDSAGPAILIRVESAYSYAWPDIVADFLLERLQAARRA